MKITCQSCQAKYTIADEKVLGKIVKIRCKKCAATIVVNGDAAASGSSPPESIAGYGAGEGAGAPDDWSVHVAEGDQRTMSEADLISAYQTGAIGDETFCWKDGMGDWLPLREIDRLYEACTATHAVQENGVGGQHEAPSAAPLAARRVGGRAGGDLFGGVAQAGSEQDVLTSAPEKIPEPQADPRTGARNENSVLFSLSALTSKGGIGDRPLPMPGSEQSGLIDIRQLSAQMGEQDSKKKSRIDDIMNLAGGGAFSPSLQGPVLAAPPLEQYSGTGADGTSAPAGGRKKMLLLGAGALTLVAAGLVGAMMMSSKEPESAKATGAGSASSATATAAPSASTAAAAASASEAPVASAAPSAAASGSAAAQDAPKPAASKPAATAAAAATPKPAAATTPKAAAPAGLAAAMAPGAASAPAAAAAAPESDQPFNMGEAKSKLAAMASSLDACKKPSGPTGTGRVVVTFGPSGAAQSAAVSGPPFEGTPTGACVAARFRSVRVPAFGGSPFSVSKSFSIN